MLWTPLPSFGTRCRAKPRFITPDHAAMLVIRPAARVWRSVRKGDAARGMSILTIENI